MHFASISSDPSRKQSSGHSPSLVLLLDQVPGARDEALALSRFACQHGASALFQPLAELPDSLTRPHRTPTALEEVAPGPPLPR